MLIDGIFNASCVAINVVIRVGYHAVRVVDGIVEGLGK